MLIYLVELSKFFSLVESSSLFFIMFPSSFLFSLILICIMFLSIAFVRIYGLNLIYYHLNPNPNFLSSFFRPRLVAHISGLSWIKRKKKILLTTTPWFRPFVHLFQLFICSTISYDYGDD